MGLLFFVFVTCCVIVVICAVFTHLHNARRRLDRAATRRRGKEGEGEVVAAVGLDKAQASSGKRLKRKKKTTADRKEGSKEPKDSKEKGSDSNSGEQLPPPSTLPAPGVRVMAADDYFRKLPVTRDPAMPRPTVEKADRTYNPPYEALTVWKAVEGGSNMEDIVFEGTGVTPPSRMPPPIAPPIDPKSAAKQKKQRTGLFRRNKKNTKT